MNARVISKWVVIVLVGYLQTSLVSGRAKPPYSGILLTAAQNNQAVQGLIQSALLGSIIPSKSSSSNSGGGSSNSGGGGGDKNLYVYIPDENRVVLIKVGDGYHDPVEIDSADVPAPAFAGNGTLAFDPTAFFMKLTPNLKAILNPVDITNFLTALNALNVLGPDSLAAYSTIVSSIKVTQPISQLTLLVNALNDISPSNPLVLTNILSIISSTDVTNPLADLTSFLKVIGIVNPLNPALLVKIFNIINPTVVPLRKIWSIMKNQTLQELEKPIFFVKPDKADNGTSSEDIRPYPTTTTTATAAATASRVPGVAMDVVYTTVYTTFVDTVVIDEQPSAPSDATGLIPSPITQIVVLPQTTSEPIELMPSAVTSETKTLVSTSIVYTSVYVTLVHTVTVNLPEPQAALPASPTQLEPSLAPVVSESAASTTATAELAVSTSGTPLAAITSAVTPTTPTAVQASKPTATSKRTNAASVSVTIEYLPSLSTEVVAAAAATAGSSTIKVADLQPSAVAADKPKVAPTTSKT